MWTYEKRLQYPIGAIQPNARLAQMIITQYGGPDGELGASLRYLSQRYNMPWNEAKAALTDIGTEELAHLEMVGAVVYKLSKNTMPDDVLEKNFQSYFVDHTLGIYPQAAAGYPYTTASMQVKGDPITDLSEDMAAEMKARTTYENLLRLSDDPTVNDVLRFLREREIVHYQRFGEVMRIAQEHLDEKNFFAFNPAYDK